MKFPFFKALLVAGVLATTWNCADDVTINYNGNYADWQDGSAIFDTGDGNVFIGEDNVVKDEEGNVIGTYDPNTQQIVGSDGEVQFEGVNKEELPVVEIPADTGSDNGSNTGNGTNTGNGSSTGTGTGAGNGTGTGTGTGTNADSGTGAGNSTGTGSDAGNGAGAGSSTSNGNGNGVESSTSAGSNNDNGNNNENASSGDNNNSTSDQPQKGDNETCYDKASGKYVKYYENLKGSKDEQYAYDNNCELKCWHDPTGNDCKQISGSSTQQGGDNTGSTGGNNTGSSSSSSNQQANPQSSNGSSQQGGNNGGGSTTTPTYPNGTTPNFEINESGRSGKAFGSRYWDCCKPHCGWNDNANGHPSSTCGVGGTTKVGADTQCFKNGGNAGTCTTQIPKVINENLAYAFAAVPGHLGGECGKCFLITFTGKSNGVDEARAQKLKGKQMVIMVSNIGYDVKNDQFDIMIPGGGFGEFNCCTNQIGVSYTGKEYGGFIHDCGGWQNQENDSGIPEIQNCVEEKCRSVFANNPNMLEGCLFSVNWYSVANNPEFNFKELKSCPQELVDRY